MNIAQKIPVTGDARSDLACEAALAAANVINDQFGHRLISAYKGQHDVQLSADLAAQKIIVDMLRSAYPDHGIVAEEGDLGRWGGRRFLWAVDPLDGTNNFGYGVAHCALAITLFEAESVVLALVYDPIVRRWFFKVKDGEGTPRPIPRHTPLSRATLSLVTGYAEPGREWGGEFAQWMAPRCKRMVNLWAPALDLALVSSGSLDAMVCRDAAFLDVCGGMFLVREAGGRVLDFDGNPLQVRRSMHEQPVSFIAAHSEALALELLGTVDAFERRRSSVECSLYATGQEALIHG